MPKIDLETIANLQNESSVVATINVNFQMIEDALEEVLFRDGEGAAANNAMLVDLDMNGKRIFNLPVPIDPLEAARHGDLQQYVDGAQAAQLAAETAQGIAEDAQTDAQTAQTAAEMAEVNSQTILTEIETHSINTGVSTPVDIGTKSTGSFQPEPSDGALLTGINGGAHTLLAPTGTGWYRLVYINSATAGAVTVDVSTVDKFDILMDAENNRAHTVEGSVLEFIAINDGVRKVMQVTLLLDATPEE